jgi:transcriptional regulator with XRE-family HTH domain
MDNFVGTKIRKIRELKGFSQEYISSKTAMSQTAYSKIESMTTKKIEDGKLNEIAKALEVEVDDILNFNEGMIFYNCRQSGQLNTITNNHNPIEKIQTLYEQIIEQLKTENAYLKQQLENKK